MSQLDLIIKHYNALSETMKSKQKCYGSGIIEQMKSHKNKFNSEDQFLIIKFGRARNKSVHEGCMHDQDYIDNILSENIDNDKSVDKKLIK